MDDIETAAIQINKDTGIEKIEMVFNSDKVRGKDQFKQIEKNQIKSDLKKAGMSKEDINTLVKDEFIVNPRNTSMTWY